MTFHDEDELQMTLQSDCMQAQQISARPWDICEAKMQWKRAEMWGKIGPKFDDEKVGSCDT